MSYSHFTKTLLLLFTLLICSTFATTLTVNNSGGADYTTIQSAVDASIAGDTILVSAGTYTEKVSISKALTLEGSGVEQTIIVPPYPNHGIHVYYASNVAISNLTIKNASYQRYGLFLDRAENCTFSDISMYGSFDNFCVYGSTSTYYTHSFSNVSIENKPLYYIHNLPNDTIENVEAGEIFISFSNGIVVRNCTMNSGDNIQISHTSNATVKNCTLQNVKQHGIYLYQSPNATIENNTISSPKQHGIYVYKSDFCAITANQISNAPYPRYGLFLNYSTNATLTDNVLSGNYYNLYSAGNNTIHWDHTIDTTNTIQGKPVYYYYNESNSTVENKNAGTMYLAYCYNMTIDNCVIDTADGIHFYQTHNSTIKNSVTGYTRLYSIQLHFSDNNVIKTNQLNHPQSGHNVYLYQSDNNTIEGNNIEGAPYPKYGTYLYYSMGNSIFHNNYLNNYKDAYDQQPQSNTYYNTLSLEGNYWDEYTGIDDGSGIDKHAIADDGIGDTNLDFPGAGYDNYPLMEHYTAPASAPVADAGDNMTVHCGTLTAIDGSSSVDPEENYPLNYAWTLLSKPALSAVSLQNDTSEAATITPDASGDYVIELVVTNASDIPSLPVSVVVTATNTQPIADAGSDFNADINTLVQLDGSSSSDADGDSLDYTWAIVSQPSGGIAALSDASAMQPTFTPNVSGDYEISLLVSDGFESSDVHIIIVSASGSTISGTASDASAHTYTFNEDNTTGQLYHADGVTPLSANDVIELYGTADGVTIFENGIDVCSYEYMTLKGLDRPLHPMYLDLSDAAGWPAIDVPADAVAIDPYTGRFKFSEGSKYEYISNFSANAGDGVVISTWNNPVATDWIGTKIVKNTGHYPVDTTDGEVIYDGTNNSCIDDAVSNDTTYYYTAFAYNAQGIISAVQTSAVPQSGAGTNLIVNPGFEEGETYGLGTNWSKWSVATSQATFEVTDSISAAGSYSQKLYLDTTATSGAFVNQNINVEENTTYLVIADLINTSSANMSLFVKGYGWEYSSALSVPQTMTFQTYSFEFTTPDNGGNLISSTLQINHPGTPGEAIFMDNVRLYKIPTTPADELISIQSQAWIGFGVPGSGDVKIQGNYAYIASGEGDFQILDISDKTNPSVIGHLGVEFNRYVEIAGDIAYLAKYNGIATLDISDRTSPQWVDGIYQHPNTNNVPWVPSNGGTCQEITVANNVAYATVSGSTNAFYILDISDPTAITEISSVDINNDLGAVKLAIEDTLAYIGINGNPGNFSTPDSAAGGAVIVNISDINAPAIIGQYTGEAGDGLYDKPYFVGNNGSTLVFTSQWRPANYAPAKDARLIFVDASNPSQPVKTSEYVFAGEAWVNIQRVAGSGSFVYATNQNEQCNQCGLWPTYPKTQLLTFDISNINSVQLVDTYEQTESSKYRYITADDHYLYINDYNYGVRIFDIATPNLPQAIGGTTTANEGHYAQINDDATYAYVSKTFGGAIDIIDIQDLSNPQVVGTYWDGNWNEYSEFVSRDDYIYMPIWGRDNTGTIAIIDAYDPANPAKIGTFPATESEGDPRIALYDELAVVTTWEHNVPVWGQDKASLKLFNIANAEQPYLRSSINLTEELGLTGHCQITTDGSYAYLVSKDDNTLVIVDITNPAYPTIVSSFTDTTNFVFSTEYENMGRIRISNGYAYVIGSGKLHILNVSDQTQPVFVKSIAGTTFRDIKISGRYMYLGLYGSLEVFDIIDAENPVKILNAAEEGISWASGWSSGALFGNVLYSPSLDNLNIVEIPRDTQAPSGQISADYRSVQ